MKIAGKRNEAKLLGLKKYISDTVCKYCGSFERYVSNYGCVPCNIEEGLKKLNNNKLMTPYRTKDKQAKQLRNWRSKNPNKVKAQRQRQKKHQSEYYFVNRDKINNSRLKRVYDITLEDFKNLLKQQNYKCIICGTDNPGRRSWHIDHCHKTNKIRGILCRKCNIGLGYFNDDITLLEKAKIYLEKF